MSNGPLFKADPNVWACRACANGDHDDCDNGYPAELLYPWCECEVCNAEFVKNGVS